MTALMNWLAQLLPGYKTQILAWGTAGLGGVLLFLEWIQTVDLSTIIPPQYYATFMLVLGLLISLTRSLASREVKKEVVSETTTTTTVEVKK